MEIDQVAKTGDSEDDRDKILKLLKNLRSLLDEIVAGEEFTALFYADLLRPMRGAWQVVNERFPELFRRVEECPYDVLESHGLTSVELDFKIEVIKVLSERTQSILGQSSSPLGFTLSGPRLLKVLLEAFDKFLSSVIDAVGAGGAIGEFKGFVESSLDGNSGIEISSAVRLE